MTRNRIFKAAMITCTLLLIVCPAFSMTHDKAPIRRKREESVKKEEQTQTVKSSSTSTTQAAKTTGTKNVKKATKTAKKQTRTYNVLNNFNLTASSPYAILTKSGGSKISLAFTRDGSSFVIPDAQRAIPKGTRLTVPDGYFACCVEGHTKMLDGKGQRVDYNGSTKIQYDPGSEIEYTEASGLVLLPVNYAENNIPARVPEVDEPEESVVVEPVSKPDVTRDFDNRSVKPEDVISHYDLPENRKNDLINAHREALKMKSKPERSERYEEIFRSYDKDYLAAYYVALVEFERNHGSRSCEWCNKALAINPRYLPAKQLLRKAQGLMKSI